MARANHSRQGVQGQGLHGLPVREARRPGKPARYELVIHHVRFAPRYSCFCTKCHAEPRRSPSQRWCRACAARWQREHRPAYADLSPREIARQRARARLRSAVRRGIVRRLPCLVCGATRGVHGHHEDYRFPLDVMWVCPTHHRWIHRIGGDAMK